MPHFQLPHSALYPGGTRLFLDGDSGMERLVLQPGKRVTLELAGLASATAKAAIQSSVPGIVTISNLVTRGTTRSFTLTATAPGATQLVAVDGAGTSLGDSGLFFVQVGVFENHSGMETDLIADTFRGADAAKMHVLTRMLFNNWENLFNESSEANQRHWCKDYVTKKKRCLPCGTVSKAGGSQIWKPIGYHYKNSYYRPIDPAKRNATLQREDIKYEEKRIKQACAAFQKRLQKGQPSVVGLVYIPSRAIRSGGDFLVTGTGGHSVPIVGCDKNATKFLYIDVFPQGSKLKYDGGHAGGNLFSATCDHLGMFELVDDPLRGTKVLRQEKATESVMFNGASFLEVVSGPIDAVEKGE